MNFDYCGVYFGCETEGVTYKYIVNGGEEQTAPADGRIYFYEYGTYELTFWAEKEGMRASKKETETIVYKDPFEMSFSVADGVYPYGTEISVNCEAGSSATYSYLIEYADGWDTKKTDVDYEDLKFVLTRDCTITVNLEYKYGDTTNKIIGTFKVEAPAAPVFSNEGGLVLAGTEVALTAAEGVQVYYTTDGTDPNNESKLYTEPIVVNDDVTIRAIGYAGETASTISEATFDVQKSLAEINALAKDSKVLYSGELTVVYVNGQNVYVYDGKDYALLYKKNLGLNAGDVIKSGWEGAIDIYNGLVEIVPNSIEKATDATALTAVPVEVRRNDCEQFIVNENLHAYFALKNVEIKSLGTDKYFEAYFGAEEIESFKLYNRFGNEDFSEAGHYDVVGFVGIYDKNDEITVQVYPVQMTLLDNPMIKVYWHNHNGNASIGWNKPHVHYSLDGENFDNVVKMVSVQPEIVALAADDNAEENIPDLWEAEIPVAATHVFFTNNGDATKKTESVAAVDGKHYAATDNETTGIDAIATEADAAAPAEYYNLQGIRIAAPQPGNVYILRQGTHSYKIKF